MERAIARLVYNLSDDDCHIRFAAARTLGEIGRDNPVVKDSLIETLKDKTWFVRLSALQSVKALKLEPAVVIENVVPLLEDEHEDIREYAALTIGDLGSMAGPAAPFLTEVLSDSVWYVRGTAAWVLGQIGDISPALQVRLLRVLQEKTYEPLGAIESVETDVRVVVATNKKLDELMKEGVFREDLYYRINVMRLELPPMRERKEDIPLLVDHFIRSYNTIQNRMIDDITDEALACLMAYDYPGNIRELKNIIERSFILCKSKMIQKEHLPEPVFKPGATEHPPHSDMATLKDMEAIFLTNALRRNNWNRLKTAGDLGIHKSTLFRKIKSLGIRIPEGK